MMHASHSIVPPLSLLDAAKAVRTATPTYLLCDSSYKRASNAREVCTQKVVNGAFVCLRAVPDGTGRAVAAA